MKFYQIARMNDGSFTLQQTPVEKEPRLVWPDEFRKLYRRRNLGFSQPIFVANTSTEYIYDKNATKEEDQFHFANLPVLCLALVYWDRDAHEFLMVMAGHSVFKFDTGGNHYSDTFNLSTLAECRHNKDAMDLAHECASTEQEVRNDTK